MEGEGFAVLGVELDENGPIFYRDHTGAAVEWVFHARIRNSSLRLQRLVCVLQKHSFDGVPGEPVPSAPLKWAGLHAGYEGVLAPYAEGRVDLFAVRVEEPGLFLHSLCDYVPRRPVTRSIAFDLDYRFYDSTGKLVALNVDGVAQGTLMVRVLNEWNGKDWPARPMPTNVTRTPKDPTLKANEANVGASHEAWRAWEREVAKVKPRTTVRILTAGEY